MELFWQSLAGELKYVFEIARLICCISQFQDG